MTTRRQVLISGVVASAASAGYCLGSSYALAQTPEPRRKPITLVVPFVPGGGTDSIARELARHLSTRSGATVIVDNKGGAGGAIAAMGVARAAPDGTTLLFATSTFITHAASDPVPAYDPVKDFAPIAMLGRGPLLVVSSKASGILTLVQLVAAAKKDPGALTYCSAGPGSINHLAAELFAQTAGISMTHVPYKGSGPATLDLLAGRTQVFFATVPTIRAHVTDHRVNLLAVTSRMRSAMYPQTPTVMESGLEPFDISTWWGILAPAATPVAVVQALNQAIRDATPSLKDRLLNEGATPLSESPAAFAQILSEELVAWKKVIGHN